jgi:hypothetical protein
MITIAASSQCTSAHPQDFRSSLFPCHSMTFPNKVSGSLLAHWHNLQSSHIFSENLVNRFIGRSSLDLWLWGLLTYDRLCRQSHDILAETMTVLRIMLPEYWRWGAGERQIEIAENHL